MFWLGCCFDKIFNIACRAHVDWRTCCTAHVLWPDAAAISGHLGQSARRQSRELWLVTFWLVTGLDRRLLVASPKVAD